MTEQMIVEAVRAAGAGGIQPDPAQGAQGVAKTADPAAIERFEAAMGVNAPQAADPVPFASEAAAAWRGAMENNQGILHRIRALAELGQMHGPSMAQLTELQYEIANLAFQQEVVAKVADKSSSAIQTLVRNQ